MKNKVQKVPQSKPANGSQPSFEHLKQSGVRILRDARHVVEETGEALNEAANLTGKIIAKQLHLPRTRR